MYGVKDVRILPNFSSASPKKARIWDKNASLGLFDCKIHIFGPIDPKLRIQGANGCYLTFCQVW